MLIRNLDEIDALFIIFLGRMPENENARQSQLGRTLHLSVQAFLTSDEFERAVLDSYLGQGLLPHFALPADIRAQIEPAVTRLGLLSDFEIRGTPWPDIMFLVLNSPTIRPIVIGRYGLRGERLLQVLDSASPERPDSLAFGMEFISSSLCRGWI